MAKFHQSCSTIPQLTLNYDHSMALAVTNQHLTAKNLDCTKTSLHVCMTWTRLVLHNTDPVHVNGQDRLILVIFSQILYKAP